MKICIVSLFSPQTSVGGLERYLDTIMEEFNKRNIEVHLVTASYLKDEIEKIGSITFHKLKILNTTDKNTNKEAKKLFYYLKKLIKKEKIDVISAENFYRGVPASYAFAVNLASMEMKVPIVLRMHGHFKQELEKALVKDLFWNKIISVSKNISNHAYEAGVKVTKLSTIYPPVNTGLFRPGLGKEWLRSRINVNNNEILILHASRITGSKRHSYLESKGIPTLIEAFSSLNQNYKNLKLLIATALPPPTWQKDYDEAYKKIYEIAELNGVKDKIIVKDFKLNEMPHVYNGADIFVMASQIESFGLVYAEALSCGIPAIGTSVGGIPEIIDNGKTGYLVEPNNPVELARKMEFFINNEEKRKKMGWLGRQVIEKRFSIKKITDKLIGNFNSLINKN